MTARILMRLATSAILLLMLATLVFSAALPAASQDAVGSAFTPAPTRTATPTPGPPPPPILLEPANGFVTTATNYPPLGMPTLHWKLPLAATISHIQVSTTPGFSSYLIDTDTFADNYTPKVTWLDGAYYWRVKSGVGVSQSIYWGAYSETFTFRKDWTDNKTIKPLLVSPDDDVHRSAFQHGDFTWESIPGAAGYAFEISSDPSFNNIVYKADTLRPQHMPEQRLASSIYYWRVTPYAYSDYNTAKVVGTPSAVRQFVVDWNTPPTPLAPAHLANQEFTPRFQWTAVEGAEHYVLELSSDADFNPSWTYATRNTDFTPTEALANDKEYYWRVKALDSNGNITQWSQVWSFRAKWNLAPQLLTPANNQIKLMYPYFSWIPVPGAERYQIQIDTSNQFNPPVIDSVTLYNVTDYTQPSWRYIYWDRDYYWRVRAIDAQNNYTPWSETWTFRLTEDQLDPNLGSSGPNPIYPPVYYAPDASRLPVHRDPAIPSPVFVWNTTHHWIGNLAFGPDHYQLTVDDDPGFGSPNFQITSRTLAAAPTLSHPFVIASPNPTLYYWRVRAYWDPAGTQQMGSDIRWVFLYAPAAPAAVSAQPAPPAQLYPRDGFQAVAAPPVLGWQSTAGAGSYHIQISRRPDFGDVVDEAHAQFVNYVPWQGRTTDMPFGTYWWRVRAETSPNQPLTDWSQVRMFSLSVDLMMGNPTDFVPPLPPPTSTLLTGGNGATYAPQVTYIASSTSLTGDAYELERMHMMLDRNNYNGNLNWVIAFNIHPTPGQTVRYGLYFDIDHSADSPDCGGPRPNPPYSPAIGSDALYQPEQAIYVDFNADLITDTAFLSDSVTYFHWNSSQQSPACAWTPASTLANIGGAAWYDAATGAVQLLVPYSALGGADDNFSGSLALTLFSMNQDGLAGMHDSVPQQGELLADPAGHVDSPAFVSDMLAPLYPFDTTLADTYTFYDMPALHWAAPLFDSVDGYYVQVARDERFSQIVETWETYESNLYSVFAAFPAAFQSKAANNDNESYYWRVRVRHERYVAANSALFDYGPWSPPMRFKLDSRLVDHLALSTGPNVFMTPTFTWDRIEGAAGYTFQLDDDDKFGSPLIDTLTDATSFTPGESTGSGGLQSMTQYYWRVRMRRSDNVLGQWTEPQPLFKTSISPAPEFPLTTDPLTVLAEQPTFLWTTVLTPTDAPRLATPRYRIQVDDDPNFASINLDAVTQGTAYTPSRGKSLPDGPLYRRVAIYETSGKSGPFSTPQAFVKQYPKPNPLWPPLTGAPGTVPAFEWEPAAGAAYYTVEYAKNSAFQNATATDTVNTTYTPTKSMSNGTYFWRIRMYDMDKVPGPIEEGQFTLGFAVYLPSIKRAPANVMPK